MTNQIQIFHNSLHALAEAMKGQLSKQGTKIDELNTKIESCSQLVLDQFSKS